MKIKIIACRNIVGIGLKKSGEIIDVGDRLGEQLIYQKIAIEITDNIDNDIDIEES